MERSAHFTNNLRRHCKSKVISEFLSLHIMQLESEDVGVGLARRLSVGAEIVTNNQASELGHVFNDLDRLVGLEDLITGATAENLCTTNRYVFIANGDIIFDHVVDDWLDLHRGQRLGLGRSLSLTAWHRFVNRRLLVPE